MEAGGTRGNATVRRALEHHFIQKTLKCATIGMMWFPVVFVVGLTIYAYYVYVVEYCILTLLQYDPPLVVRAVLYLITVNILMAMMLVNFLITTFRDPGTPTAYKLESAGSAEHLVGWRDDTSAGKPVFILPAGRDRYCGICDTPKPERCHHCSVCEKCRLKMDHHCPWFNNCIGYRNYKCFMLTLFWTFFLTVFMVATLLQELIWELSNNQTKGDSIQFLVICIISFVMGISSTVLLVYHLYLISANMTTLEQLDRTEARHSSEEIVPPHHIYDVGWRKNFIQVLGRNPLLWLLPIPVDECQMGLVFPKRPSERVEQV